MPNFPVPLLHYVPLLPYLPLLHYVPLLPYVPLLAHIPLQLCIIPSPPPLPPVLPHGSTNNSDGDLTK